MRSRYMKNMNQSEIKTENKASKEKESIAKIAFRKTKASKKGLSMPLFWFSFFTLISLMIGYLEPTTLILTIPFVILPSFFAFLALNSMSKARPGDGIGFFFLFRKYFSQLFHGGFKVLIGLLKFVLFYFVSNLCLTVVYEEFFLKDSSEYEALLDSMTENINLNDLFKQYNDLINSNQEFQIALFLITSISILVGFIAFIDHIGKNCPKFNFNFFNKQPIPLRQFNIIDKETRRKNRSEFFKCYFCSTWFVHLLLVIGAAGGVSIGYFVLNGLNIGQTVIISLAIMFLLMLPFMNYLSKVFETIYFKFSKQYESTFVEMTLNLITKYRKQVGLSEEQAKEIEDMLEEQKQAFKEEDKGDKDEEDKQ